MPSEDGFFIGPVGILLALVGVLASYMATLYGAELNQQSLAGFGFWTVISLLVAFLVDWLFKFVLILVVLFVAALWWTDSAAFRGAAAQAEALQGAICNKITLEVEGVPYKDWIC